MGTMRLAVVFGSGLIGILCRVLVITTVVNGQVEIGPTVVSIHDVESKGFPDNQYLKVTDAYLVLSVPHLKTTGGEDDPGELSRLTVPAVSELQW